jgi:hypothetical protein
MALVPLPTNRLPGATRVNGEICNSRRCARSGSSRSTVISQTIEHDMRDGAHRNLLNRDRFSVSYGVYVAHIDAPDVGERSSNSR